jgi:hypothetical protein
LDSGSASPIGGRPAIGPGPHSSLCKAPTDAERGSSSRGVDAAPPREILPVADARSSKEIANDLVISIKTVERHRQNILDKLGMSDCVELTRYAIRRGLIQH